MEQRPLHWSERAKMYPPRPVAGTGEAPKPRGPRRKPQSGHKAPKKPSSRKGFLVIMAFVLLVVGAAALVFFWYLPSRGDGDGAELDARQLVRQAMTAMDKAYADTQTFDPQTMTPEKLSAIATAVVFRPVSDTSAATAPTAQAKDNAVSYAGTQTSYAVGTLSESGAAYGAVIDKTQNTVTYYLGGNEVSNWEAAPGSATTTPGSQTTDTSGVTTSTSTAPGGPISVAYDAEAVSLVRNAMTTVEAVYIQVNTFEPSTMTADLLNQTEPSTIFVIREGAEAALDPVSLAAESTVDFFGTTTTYTLGAKSQSGTTFGVMATKGAGGVTTTYYVNGQVEEWGPALTGIIGSLYPAWG